MKRKPRVFLALGGLLIALTAADPAVAQKSGVILRMYSPDSPASMSIYEKATVFAEMGVFNNLVILDHCVKQNSLETIVIWPLADAWKSSG